MQKLRYSRYFKIWFVLIDLLVLSGIFIFFIYREEPDNIFTPQTFEKRSITLFILILYWLLISGKSLIYSVPRNLTYTKYLERFSSHIFFFICGIWLLSAVLADPFVKQNRVPMAVCIFLTTLFWKSSIFFFLKHIRTQGINLRHIMLLGENQSTEILRRTLSERKDYGYKIFNFSENHFKISDLVIFWKDNGIHTLFYAPNKEIFSKEFERELFENAEIYDVKIIIVPKISQNHFFSYDLSYIESQPILLPTKFPLQHFSNFILKRVFDVVFSLFFLISVGIWLFPILAILIKIDSKGSVLFIQKRYGYKNRVFSCYKFRTMYENNFSSTRTTAENDSRITPIGRFLRKSSLDEMPQFINVLFGDMSIIGPRPHMIMVDDLYKQKIKRYSIRSLVKPGITGLAQVNGLRGDKGNIDIEMKKRILADHFYVKNWSFSLDLVILFKTFILLINGDKNAH